MVRLLAGDSVVGGGGAGVCAGCVGVVRAFVVGGVSVGWRGVVGGVRLSSRRSQCSPLEEREVYEWDGVNVQG